MNKDHSASALLNENCQPCRRDLPPYQVKQAETHATVGSRATGGASKPKATQRRTAIEVGWAGRAVRSDPRWIRTANFWKKDTFAFADDYDETAGRYRGLRCGQIVNVSTEGSTGFLVQQQIATQQQIAEAPAPTDFSQTPKKPGGRTHPDAPSLATPMPQPITAPRRFHGSVELDPTRVGRDAGRIAYEVIAHLAGLVGTTVQVTLDIAAEIPLGAPDQVVRTVTENSRTFKFKTQGFEQQ